MGVKQDSRFMKMFKVMAAFMLGIAFCLGFTACSDNDENGNGNDGDNTTTVVNPEKVFTGGLPKSVSGMSISQNEEGLVTLQLMRAKRPSSNIFLLHGRRLQ